MVKKRTLTVKQLAKKLDLTENWIRILARRGEIPGTKKGHPWFFNEDEVKTALYIDNSFKN